MVIFTDGGVRHGQIRAAAGWIITAVVGGIPYLVAEGGLSIPHISQMISYGVETNAIDHAIRTVKAKRLSEHHRLQLISHLLSVKLAIFLSK